MRRAGIKAIRQALDNANDNLYRARCQQRANPEWKSGNDDRIADMVTNYERERDDLNAALAEAMTE